MISCGSRSVSTLLLFAFCCGIAGAETLGTISSPGNILSVSVTVNDEGRPVRFRNAGKKSYHWQAVRFRADDGG